MITPIQLKCPNCRANLEVDSRLRQCFCTHCGTKIILHNENEFISRHIDEAKLAEQENERLRIELEQKRYEDKLERQKAEREQRTKDGAAIGRISMLAVLFGFPSLYLIIGGFAEIVFGGFLNVLKGLLCYVDLAGLWFGFAIMIGKTEFPKRLAIPVLSASGLLFLFSMVWLFKVLNAQP